MAACLNAVLAAELPGGLDREIVRVDDGSSGTAWLMAQQFAVEHAGAIRIFQPLRNRGKGEALRRAISEITGDLVIFQDADLEYDPGDYKGILKPILDGRAEVVYGSRFIGQERKIL